MPESLNQVPALLAVDDADIQSIEEEISISSEIRPTLLTYRRCLELSSRDFVVGTNVYAIVNEGVFVDHAIFSPEDELNVEAESSKKLGTIAETVDEEELDDFGNALAGPSAPAHGAPEAVEFDEELSHTHSSSRGRHTTRNVLVEISALVSLHLEWQEVGPLVGLSLAPFSSCRNL